MRVQSAQRVAGNALLRIVPVVALMCLGFVPKGCAMPTSAELQSLEQRADGEFLKRDCVAAEKSYVEAVSLAQSERAAGGTGLYYRRIGICRARLGKLSEALEAYRQGIDATETSGNIDLLAENVHGASLALQKLGRMDDALVMAQREYELTQKCGHPEHFVRAMWLVAELYDATGKTRAGLQLLNKALSISRTTTDHEGTLILLDNLAQRYATLGDYDVAMQMEKEILGTLASAVPATKALAYNNLGEIQMRSGHPDLAWKSWELAVESSKDPDSWRVHIGALLNVADMRNRAGQTARSDDAFREALDVARNVKIPDLESVGHRMVSEALRSRGDVSGASDAATEALRIARQIASANRTYEALLALGSAKSAAGEAEPARTCFDEALQIAETLRAQTSGEATDLRGAFTHLLPLYQASVRNLIDLHLPAEALQRAEQAKARVLMDILLRGGVDERAVMTSAEAGQQDQLRKRLAVANEAASKTPSPATSATVQEVMRDYRQFRRGVYDAHPDLAVQAADFEPAGLDKLRAVLPGPKTALLDYFLVPSGVALFVVRLGEGDGQPEVRAYLLPDPKHTLAAEALAFRKQLANRELAYKAAAQHLFNRLLSPAIEGLRGSTDWVISPDGALWNIPFGALVDSAGKHVIETRAVAMAPSLTAALEIHQRRELASNRRAAPGDLRLLALGNPLPSTAPLPDAAREVAEISANYPHGSAMVLTGVSATAATFRDKAPAASIIHLAAHAGLNDNDPLSSFVRLGDGKTGAAGDGMLTALDIMSLHLRADLVVLSACETALGSAGPGEGMIGMGWALSAAGAASSVLSFWKVDSVASRDFMTLFYKDLMVAGESISRSTALRRAGLKMLQSSTYRHPFYWAAFTLWGDGAALRSATGH